MSPTPNQIANAIESVMTNLTSVHNDVVQAICESDQTIGGVIAAINNDVYPISNVMYPFIAAKLKEIGL